MHVYIMTNKSNNVLYVGVTNDIKRRIEEHKQGINDGFTKKYNVVKLVYCEEITNADDAIRREKQLKSWTRQKKISLVQTLNPDWNDISDILNN